jgi:hypothetical protein
LKNSYDLKACNDNPNLKRLAVKKTQEGGLSPSRKKNKNWQLT